MEKMNHTEFESPQQNEFDIRPFFRQLWQRRKVFYWVLPITFILSSAVILCVPRYYTCEVILAPETQSAGSSGSLQSLASSFGFDMRSMSNTDAIYPTIYPEVVNSPNFLITLFDVPVVTDDGNFSGTYYDYLIMLQRESFKSRLKGRISSWFSNQEESETSEVQNDLNVFNLSQPQWNAIQSMRDNITCVVNKKTEVVKFSVTSRDRLVCAILADSVCAAMQKFIIDYRTRKTRVDIAYYADIMQKTYQEYQEASERYIRYVDSHSGMNQEKYRIEAQNLESEMQIKQAAYTSFQKQYLAAEARLQENTPVYTEIQSATIPLSAAGPRRAMFVFVMLFFATCVTSCVVCKDQLVNILKM